MSKRVLTVALLMAVSAVSCTIRQEIEECRMITISLDSTSVKTSLNAGRTQLKWTAGDVISVYNDVDKTISAATYDSGAPIRVPVPVGATTLKATYPTTSGSYAEPGFIFSKSQTQTVAGTLNGEYYPLVAESAIVDEAADFHFTPVGSAFAVNIFNPTLETEKLMSLSVQPSQLAESVSLTLGTPWLLPAAAPADRRTYPGQVYVCVPKGSYSKVVFIVNTTHAQYTITSNDNLMDLVNYDFFTVNLNLQKLTATVFVNGIDPEGFTEGEAIDVTGLESSFVEFHSRVLEPQLTKDTIPDFSSVGYRWGEKDFPDYSNVINLPAPSGDDDTETIQNAIDSAPERSVIQFQAGRYIVDGILIVDKSYIILRGYGTRETEIFARGTVPLDDVDPTASGQFYEPVRFLINLGVSVPGNRTKEYSASVANIKVTNLDGRLIENHPDAWYVHGTCMNSATGTSYGISTDIIGNAYCGSTFVTVKDPSSFNVGDQVSIYRPGTTQWIHDLKMDMIIKSLSDIGKITQWSAASYGMSWERRIKAIAGNRLYFDAPLVMSITDEYGGGQVLHSTTQRIKECGVENLNIVSDYNPDRNSATYGIGDIYHADHAITFYGAEHCWVKDVHTHFFSSTAVAMSRYAKNITVQNCAQWEPAAYIRGSLRYAFHINGGQYCLVKDCTSDNDRHQFVTAAKVPGPNVFLRCTGTNALSNIGPHQRWATGTLYDHVSTTREVSAIDAGNSGTGQGWQGVNQVFWCCEGSKFYMQNPWVTGKNYAIGCTISGAPATLTTNSSYPNPGYAPDGSVVYDNVVNGPRINSECRALRTGEPASLYEYQLARRKAAGDLISNYVAD